MPEVTCVPLWVRNITVALLTSLGPLCDGWVKWPGAVWASFSPHGVLLLTDLLKASLPSLLRASCIPQNQNRRLPGFFWLWLRTGTVWLLPQSIDQSKVQGHPDSRWREVNSALWWKEHRQEQGSRNYWFLSLQAILFPFSASIPFSLTSVSWGHLLKVLNTQIFVSGAYARDLGGNWDREKPGS